jgi:SAM-dependent methyltransferase
MSVDLKKLYWELIADRSQEKAIGRFLRNAGLGPESKMLDVGCGYGRNLRALREFGFEATGVEINTAIAGAVRAEGFKCIEPHEFESDSSEWDAILFSHIIEHFEPVALLQMMDNYLSKLKAGGVVVIASPLPNKAFWDNFDHIKPYTPQAVEEVFGLRNRQVQFQSKHELELVDLWIRRRAFQFRMQASLLKRGMSLPKAVFGGFNVLAAIGHRLSNSRFGAPDGWVGIYRKTPSPHTAIIHP